jgi:Ni2+-binding GTPase involved in maturation of urease and hydrogenase
MRKKKEVKTMLGFKSFKDLLTEKKPFAVVQHFIGARFDDERAKVFESIWYDDKRGLLTRELCHKEVQLLFSNLHLFQKVIEGNDGTVYEYQHFDEYYWAKSLNS